MNNNYFFDTNIFIYHLKNEEKVRDYFSKSFSLKNYVYFSDITKIELLSFNQITSNEDYLIRKLLDSFNVVSISQFVVDKTIEIRKKYNIKIADAIIASSAIVKNAVLITRNISDFKNIKELKIINPFD